MFPNGNPPPDEFLPLAEIDRQIRINELREAALEESTPGRRPPDPMGISRAHWQAMIEWESLEMTCHFLQLERRGVEVPDPRRLGHAQLCDKLWEVIRALAEMQVFLENTDHLSDRQLYTLLWSDLLWESTPDYPPDSGWQNHLDILGGCSEEDLFLRLKHYADEEEREQWRRDWPADDVPPHVDPPYDRDSRLPKAD